MDIHVRLPFGAVAVEVYEDDTWGDVRARLLDDHHVQLSGRVLVYEGAAVEDADRVFDAGLCAGEEVLVEELPRRLWLSRVRCRTTSGDVCGVRVTTSGDALIFGGDIEEMVDGEPVLEWMGASLSFPARAPRFDDVPHTEACYLEDTRVALHPSELITVIASNTAVPDEVLIFDGRVRNAGAPAGCHTCSRRVSSEDLGSRGGGPVDASRVVFSSCGTYLAVTCTNGGGPRAAVYRVPVEGGGAWERVGCVDGTVQDLQGAPSGPCVAAVACTESQKVLFVDIADGRALASSVPFAADEIPDLTVRFAAPRTGCAVCTVDASDRRCPRYAVGLSTATGGVLWRVDLANDWRVGRVAPVPVLGHLVEVDMAACWKMRLRDARSGAISGRVVLDTPDRDSDLDGRVCTALEFSACGGFAVVTYEHPLRHCAPEEQRIAVYTVREEPDDAGGGGAAGDDPRVTAPTRSGAVRHWTYFRVHNASSRDVGVFWDNSDGTVPEAAAVAQLYERLQPGESVTQHTWPGHRWLFGDAGGDLGSFEGHPVAHMVVVRDNECTAAPIAFPPQRREAARPDNWVALG